MKILNKFKEITNKLITIKRIREDRFKHRDFLRGSANLAYVHASKLFGLEDSTKQASKASNAYTWLPRCQ